MNELNPQQSHCHQEVQLEYGHKCFSKKKKIKMREYGESYINSKKISDKYTYGKARENLVKSLGYMYIPLNWSIT